MSVSKRIKKYVVKHEDGRYYSFTDKQTYDMPQFSRDIRDAKLMTAQGAGSVIKRLADPKYYGQTFFRALVE